MQDYGWGMFRKGLYRRKKEVRRMRKMICLAVFFLAVSILLQDNLGNLQMAQNYRKYGEWFGYAENDFFENDGYLEAGGYCRVGSDIYTLYSKNHDADGSIYNDIAPVITVGEDGESHNRKPAIYDESGTLLPPSEHVIVTDLAASRDTYKVIGAYSEGFAEKNGITLFEGRFPENDNEIVMEREVLHALGLSYELGQEIAFYLAESEPIAEGIEVIDESELYIPLDLVRFTLVGTVRLYTMTWSGGKDLPAAIITESAFDELPCFKKEYRFYDLGMKEELERAKVWDFASALFSSYQERKLDGYTPADGSETPETICWNKNAYTNPLWGSGKLYNYITIALLVMSSCILAYLIASYLSSRRRYFMQIREIGASSTNVWWMAVYDCIVSSLPYAAGAIAAAYITAILAARAAAEVDKLDYRFIFRIGTFCLIVAAVLAVLAAAMTTAYAVFSGRGLAEKKKELSKGASRSLRRRAEKQLDSRKSYLGLRETLRRLRRIGRLKTWLIRFACILIGAVILFSFMQLFTAVYEFAGTKANWDDLSGDAFEFGSMRGKAAVLDTEPHWNMSGTGKVSTVTGHVAPMQYLFYSYRNVLNSSFINELNAVPGVKDASYETFDYEHRLSWPGKWEDAFLTHCIDSGLHTCSDKLPYKLVFDGPHAEEMRRSMDTVFYMLLCFRNTRELWEKAKPYLSADADYESFVCGEQVIVFVDQNAYGPELGIYAGVKAEASRSEYAEYAENLWQKMPSFRNGDTVYIDSLSRSVNAVDIGSYDEYDFSECTPVKVAAVLPMTALDTAEIFGYSIPEWYLPVYLTIGSLELAHRVAEKDGLEFGVNRFQVNFTSVEEAENAMKFISGLCSEYGASYTDNVEWLREQKDNAMDKLLTYGFFAVVTTVLYIFVLNSIALQEDISLQPKYIVLHRAGLTWKQQKRQKSCAAAVQSLWQLLSLPLFLVATASASYSEDLKLLEGEAPSLKEYLPRFLRGLICRIKDIFVNFPLTPTAIVICLAVLVLVFWLANRRFTVPKE